MEIIPSVSSVSFRLTIPNISQLNDVWSPEFLIQGSPWKFYIRKELCGNKHLLGIYVYCVKEDKLDWSYAAAASFKVLTFDNRRKEVEEHLDPFVFDQVEAGFGTTSSIISWNDLFDVEKKYVKNDTVNLELKIDVKNPLEETKSELIFVRHSNTEFRMIVTNIDNLMAARSPPFMYKKLPFNFVVYKSHNSYLGIYLYQRGVETDTPVKLTMSAKLLSKNGICIEKVHTNFILKGVLHIEELISWSELFDIQNEFISDNNIAIFVEFKT